MDWRLRLGDLVFTAGLLDDDLEARMDFQLLDVQCGYPTSSMPRSVGGYGGELLMEALAVFVLPSALSRSGDVYDVTCYMAI